MQPLPNEQVQSTAQVLLAFLDSDGASVPGNFLEGVVSGKSLLRGLLSGNLVICQVQQEPPAPSPDDPPAKKTPRKKATKKKPA